MPSAVRTVSVNIGGLDFKSKESFEQPGLIAHALLASESNAVPATKTGTLSTRTDNNTGVLTMQGGHGITNGAVVDVYWSTPQRRSLFQLVPSGYLTGGTVYGLLPTPLASDCRGPWGRKDDNLLRNYLPRRFGGIYPHPSLLETMMGFPIGWSEPRPSATPSCRKSPS